MGRLIEGLWDCRYCHSKGIGGSNRKCPCCGKVRDENTKFYMPSSITYVSEDEAKKVNRNPDWVCIYCDSLNSDSCSVCQHCGSERNSDTPNYFEYQKKRDNNHEETTEPSVDAFKDEENVISNSRENIIQKFFRKCIHSIADLFTMYGEFIISGIVLIVIIAAIISGLVWIFSPKTQEITIEAVHWERSIKVEKYQTVNESGWTLPEGARLHKTRREIFTYQKVFDHYENRTRQVAKKRISHYEEKVVGHRDLGNGYFEEIIEKVPVYETYYEKEHYQEPVYRNEPIYKNKYYYEIDKWLYDRTLVDEGFENSPHWPDTSMLGTKERTGERKEEYYIKGTNSKGKTKKIDLSYDEWKVLKVGDKVKMKVSIFGNGELV